MSVEPTCGAPTRGGTGACAVTFGLNPENGLCFHHDPLRHEERTEARRRAGRAAHPPKNVDRLTAADFPVLNDYPDAEAALDTLHRAVATGRLESRAGAVAVSAVGQWIKARGDKLKAAEFTRLEKLLAELEKKNDELAQENAKIRTGSTNRESQ